jgi:hypothetical protein
MTWARRWRIDSREKWERILRTLADMKFDPDRHPMELIVREERREKSHEQRKLWHAVIGDLAPHLSLTPAQCKLLVKARFWGVEVKGEGDFYYALVPASEDADREEYSRLIDFTYQLAAEQGIYLPDRRT